MLKNISYAYILPDFSFVIYYLTLSIVPFKILIKQLYRGQILLIYPTEKAGNSDLRAKPKQSLNSLRAKPAPLILRQNTNGKLRPARKIKAVKDNLANVLARATLSSTVTGITAHLAQATLSGTVTGISVLSHAETPGLGAIAGAAGEKGDAFRSQFAGLTSAAVTKDGGSVNALTGATVTSRAICSGVNAALDAVKTVG